MKIAVAGMGYVGLSNAVLLARHHEVVLFDIVPEKVTMLNAGRSPIHDPDIEAALTEGMINLKATLVVSEALNGAGCVIVATSASLDTVTGEFDTSAIESVIQQVMILAPMAAVIVRSTVPVGFTARMRERYHTDKILFMAEFLREGRALYDNLHPSRLIVGDVSERGQAIADLFAAAAVTPHVPILLTGSSEAEAIKLFSNSYLAMRVAFFNEVDTFAAVNSLNAQQLIEGISLDARIGTHYNNPSFGYGGYCLPKDTKQLLGHFEGIPQQMISALVNANATRMDFIAEDILRRNPQVVGIYRLTMKSGSDNFRASSTLEIMERIQKSGVRVVVYEPLIPEHSRTGFERVATLAEFKAMADVIVANRITEEIEDCGAKLYSRDIYKRD